MRSGPKWTLERWSDLAAVVGVPLTIVGLLIGYFALGRPSHDEPGSSSGARQNQQETLDEMKPPPNQTNSVASQNVTAAQIHQEPPIDRPICPARRFADSQGSWEGHVTCNGGSFDFALVTHFRSGREIEASLTFARAEEDSSSLTRQRALRLLGRFEGSDDHVRLYAPDYDLATGYPGLELGMRGRDISAARLSGTAYDRLSQNAVCGQWTAIRQRQPFGSQGRTTITFGRQQSEASATDLDDC